MMSKETEVIDGISSRPAPPPVTGSADNSAALARTAPVPALRAAAARAQPQVAAGDTVSSPVDTDRVAALRAAIASGSYRADPIAIAQRIIAADQPLPGPTTSVTGSATGSA
jgi:negative regulator of flagellin synthesis FlgM